MEYSENVNQTIAKNLTRYRKAANLTQAELAEKINYSDKSVSKWESGNGVPDIYILLRLAELYGVTVNDLVSENAVAPTKNVTTLQRVLIMLISSGLVWLVAVAAFVSLNLFFKDRAWWLAYVYAVVVNSVLIIIFANLWKYKVTGFTAVTILIWSTLFSVFITSFIVMRRLHVGDTGSLWLIFLIGIPLQVLEILWAFFRSSLKFKKSVPAEVEKEKKTNKTEKN